MEKQIWEKNLAALDGRYKALKEMLLENPEETGTEGMRPGIALVEDKQVLYVEAEDGVYQLDTLYDTKTLMETWFELRSPGFMTKCIFCGFGNGMYVRKFLQDGDESTRILVYEPSLELFRFVMQHIDVSDLFLNERLQLLVGEAGRDELDVALDAFLDYPDLAHLIHQVYPNYKRIFREAVRDSEDRVELAYNKVVASQNLLINDGESYYRNSVHNTAVFANSRSLRDLYQKAPKDMPAIIVASGPSLDKNIEELKKAKGKCLLIAADSAIRALLRHGIEPDCYVTIDGKKNPAHFQDERVPYLPVFCTLCSNYISLTKQKGVSFFVNDLNAYVNHFMEQHEKIFPVLYMGGSVANGAMALAGALELKTVILVGQDLAYTGNKTHASETVRGMKNIDVNTLPTNVMLDGYDGEEVLSSYEFKIYRDWFEAYIAEHKDMRVINATEGGAMIHGAENLSLSEAIAECCIKEFPAREILESAAPFFTEKEREEFSAFMEAVPDKMREMRKVAKDGIREYSKMLDLVHRGKLNGGELNRLFQRTEEISQTLEQTPVMTFIHNRIQKETQRIMKTIYDTKSDPREEIMETAGIGRDYMETIEKCIVESVEELEQIRQEK